MDFMVKSEVAEKTSQNIVSRGGGFTNFAPVQIMGSNTNGVLCANALGANVGSMFSRYQAVVERDGKQITVMAKYFEDFDNNMKNQM